MAATYLLARPPAEPMPTIKKSLAPIECRLRGMAGSSMRKNPKGGWHRLERWVAPIECQHWIPLEVAVRVAWPARPCGKTQKVGGTD
jgi:hypothetical protein